LAPTSREHGPDRPAPPPNHPSQGDRDHPSAIRVQPRRAATIGDQSETSSVIRMRNCVAVGNGVIQFAPFTVFAHLADRSVATRIRASSARPRRRPWSRTLRSANAILC
jgi:hypothetical protein